MANLQSDLNEFVTLLISWSVEYLIVGGYAVAFHGHPRFTGDIAFLVRATPDNAQRLLHVLHEFGFGSVSFSVEDLTTEGRVVQLGRPPNRIDLLTSISRVTFDEAWAGRVSGSLGEHRVDFLGWDALIQNKTVTGRDKDRADVAKLLSSAASRKVADSRLQTVE